MRDVIVSSYRKRDIAEDIARAAAAYRGARRGRTSLSSGAAAWIRGPLPRLATAVLLLSLAACAQRNPEQPLTSFQIRDRLVGNMIAVTDPQGKELTMRFRHNGIATVTGATSEFVHWTVDAAQGLCLQGFEGQSRCAPVYQTAPARFRWDDTTFSVLGTGAPRLRGQTFPEPDFHRPPLLMRPR